MSNVQKAIKTKIAWDKISPVKSPRVNKLKRNEMPKKTKGSRYT